MNLKVLVFFTVISLGLFSCTTYKTQYVGFIHADDYPNRVLADGMTIGAEAYADKAAAKKAFGFDVKKSRAFARPGCNG